MKEHRLASRILNGLALTCVVIFGGCSGKNQELAPLPVNGLQVAFGSCVQRANSPVWKALQKQDPDLFISLGDIVYLSDDDLSSPKKHRDAYKRRLSDPALQRARATIQFYFIWDDHDFGINDSDSTDSYAERSLSLWGELFISPEEEVVIEGSIARQLDVGGVRFLLTDNRSFRRDHRRVTDKQEAVLFGEEQLEWIEDQILNPYDGVLVLVGGGQWLSEDGRADGLHQFPREQRRIFNALRRTPNRIAFISGDRHFSEFKEKQLGGRVFREVTISPLDAGTADAEFQGEGEKNRVQIFVSPRTLGVLSVSPTGVIARVLDDKGRELGRFELL